MKIGDVLRVFYSAGNPNNKLLHVRGFVDGYVVARQWRPRRKAWYYEILRMGELEYMQSRDWLKIEEKKGG